MKRDPEPKMTSKTELELDHLVLRYCRQIIMKTMDHVRGTMRGENRLHLKRAVTDPQLHKSKQNLTKAIDRDAEVHGLGL
jgi:hypothetical protein